MKFLDWNVSIKSNCKMILMEIFESVLFSQLGEVVNNLTKQLETKGKELNEFRERHNIRVRGEDEEKPTTKDDDASKASQGILVAPNS